MPRTPDRFPGEREEEGVLFDTTSASPPTVEGEVKYVQSIGLQVLESGTVQKVLTSEAHPKLRQLVHLADSGPWDSFWSGAYRETLPAADPFPTSIIWWEDSGKTKKVVQKLITYSVGKLPTSIQWSVFDVDGTTVISQATDTISYSAVFETSRTRTVT